MRRRGIVNFFHVYSEQGLHSPEDSKNNSKQLKWNYFSELKDKKYFIGIVAVKYPDFTRIFDYI